MAHRKRMQVNRKSGACPRPGLQCHPGSTSVARRKQWTWRHMVALAFSDISIWLVHMSGSGNDFASRMKGSFRGILPWRDLDALWERVRAEPDGWYASLIGETPAATPMSAAELDKFVSEIDALLHREHEYDYCGIVYADDPAAPSFIKIYDPHNTGSSCGSGNVPIPPRWILSRIQPTLIADNAPMPTSRRRWWQNLFGMK
ncbi:MAG: hypothetical protein WCF00_09710 [Azonexus sp.]